MGSGERRISQLGDISFRGKVGEQITVYAKGTQKLARDFAGQLETDEAAARAAMHKLKGHPLLFGLGIRICAWRVTRSLRRAKECALGLSAEAVKFSQQYRREFLEVNDAGEKAKYKGEVDI